MADNFITLLKVFRSRVSNIPDYFVTIEEVLDELYIRANSPNVYP
jgi:hypothetical protein